MRHLSLSSARRVFPILLIVATGVFCSCNGTKPDPAPTNTSPPEPKTAIRFSNVAEQAGVDFTYHNGTEEGQCSIVESLGGGVGLADFDLDGLLDICIPGGGKVAANQIISGLPAGLFRNLGEMRFESVGQAAGIDKVNHYTHGITVGDYDHDGFPDVLFTGYGGVQLWRNQGDGTFSLTQDEAGLADKSWSSSAAWGDLNGDGFLDLYLAHYVNWSWSNHPSCAANDEDGKEVRDICAPREFDALPDTLYYSNGDGTFRDVTAEAGLEGGGKGLGVMFCDVDSDNDLDIYVANDTVDNFLYLNDGTGKLKDEALINGVNADETGTANGSMGIDLCDFNGDGRYDIWVANYESEQFALYRNDGASGFYHTSKQAGIAALGGLFVGFGTAACDVDRDGDEDFVVTNGHVVKYPLAAPLRQVPLVMRNTGGFFHRVDFEKDSYFGTPQLGRGWAGGDLDEDGDVDFVITHINDPVAVLDNETESDGQWLSVLLVGTQSARDAVGARLVLDTSGGDIHRQIRGGASYLSHNDRRVFWGIPADDKVEGLTIYWPSKKTQKITSVMPSQSMIIVEPTE